MEFVGLSLHSLLEFRSFICTVSWHMQNFPNKSTERIAWWGSFQELLTYAKVSCSQASSVSTKNHNVTSAVIFQQYVTFDLYRLEERRKQAMLKLLTEVLEPVRLIMHAHRSILIIPPVYDIIAWASSTLPHCLARKRWCHSALLPRLLHPLPLPITISSGGLHAVLTD